MTDELFMRMAIGAALEGIGKGQSPFGACIVKDGDVVVCDHNRVWLDTDSTAHAEIVALRNACRRLATIELKGTTIYSTTEPCPMCFSAIHWAKVDKIVYGARISDALKAGFNELKIYNQVMAEFGGSDIEIVSDFMRDECVLLFDRWKEKATARAY